MSKGKVGLTPEQISDKWNRRMKNSIPDIQAGIAAVTESPMEKAAQKQEKMKANLIKSIDEGVWANRMRKVSLSTWKENTSKKVGERMSSGVDAAMGKRQEFDKWLTGRLNTVLPEIQKMPDLTLEDSVNRVRTMMEHMSKERYKKG